MEIDVSTTVRSKAFELFELVIGSEDVDYKAGQFIREKVYKRKVWSPSGAEVKDKWDDYDNNSIHILLKVKGTSQYVGYYRFVIGRFSGRLPSEDIAGEFFDPSWLPSNAGILNTCEVSRFSVLSGDEIVNLLPNNDARLLTIVTRTMLMFSIIAIAGLSGCRHCFALMEPKFARLIRLSSGVPFVKVGHDFSFYGTRAPYYIDRLLSYGFLSDINAEWVKTIENEIGSKVSMRINGFRNL